MLSIFQDDLPNLKCFSLTCYFGTREYENLIIPLLRRMTYLEELTLTGDNQINSLEFLTHYPLKKLRLLKLDQFNLREINLQKIFSNMTKLEIIYLNSCQLKQIPNLNHIQILNLEKNFLSNRIFLSTFYHHLNLANNQISSIILQNNPNLISLNLSNNHLNEFYSLTISNKKSLFPYTVKAKIYAIGYGLRIMPVP